MIHGKKLLIVKENIGSQSISLQSASNSIIYERAISSKLILNEKVFI